jgi:Domain of unknown function (DUF397)
VTGWVRSSFCAAGDCIEAKAVDDTILIRRTSEWLIPWERAVTRAEWDAFVAGVKAGEFDHLTDGPQGAS